MQYYFQRERRSEAVISSNSIVEFDTDLALSQTDSLTPSADFHYQTDGSINLIRPGTYVIFWFVGGVRGLASDGQSYQLKKLDYSTPTPQWTVLAGISNHIKISSFSGFSTMVVSKDELSQHGQATLALFHTADADIRLTYTHPKAGILIFGFDLDKIKTMEHSITVLMENVFASSLIEIWSTDPRLSGVGVDVIHSGFTYNFWGIGALDHQQTFTNGTTYYLLQGSQYPDLLLYQGGSLMCTLWIETPGGTIYSMPLHVDNTGIYFNPSIQLTSLPIGTTFKFSQPLILFSADGP